MNSLSTPQDAVALRREALCAASVLGLAVGAGAFGAHSLKDALPPSLMAIYEKAVLYQFIHGLGMEIVVILGTLGFLTPRSRRLINLVFFVGIVLFCGSLYTLVLTYARWIGLVTPFGGVLLLLGWLLTALAVRPPPVATSP